MREKKVKSYDFRRPDKFSKDQIRTISMIHETFARLSTVGLSAQLRTIANIRVDYVDQLTYEEFTSSISDPTIISVIDMAPLKGNAIIEISPSIAFTAIDRLLGGKGVYENNKINREITEIECGVIEEVIIRLVSNFKESWSNLIDLKPRLGRIEVNPQFAQIVPPADMVIVICLESKIYDVVGKINICLPYITIEPIYPMLSGKYWYSTVRKRSKGEDNSLLLKSIGNLKNATRLFIKGEKLSLNQIANLKKNALIKLEGYDRGECYLESGNNVVAKLYQEDAVLRNKKIYKLETNDEYGEMTFFDEERVKEENKNELLKIINEPIKDLSNLVGQFTKTIDNKIKQITDKQDEIVDQISFSLQKPVTSDKKDFTVQNKPFYFIHQFEPEIILNFLQAEYPQTIALILSFTESNFASKFLTLLNEELQYEVAVRIAEIDRISPEVLKVVEMVLERKLNYLSINDNKIGGIEPIVNILNMVNRQTELNILKRMEKIKPDLAEVIKNNMFVFEDIILLDKKSIQIVIDQITVNDAAAALKGVNEEVQKKVFDSIDKNKKNEIVEETNKLGPVRLSYIEKVQLRIVNIIKQLEESGEIMIARVDEPIVE